MDLLLNFDAIVLSPGPGLPENAGRMMDVIEKVKGKIPVLGICLGMQAIAEYLGGELSNKNEVSHGVQQTVTNLKNSPLFVELPAEFQVGLYHSWQVSSNENYKVNARSVSDETIMAISNEKMKLYGVQFHPESIMTPQGKDILKAFLSLNN